MAEMSKAVEAVYGVLFDEMKFAKRQQWTVANYMLLLVGAVLGVGAALKSLTAFEKHARSAFTSKRRLVFSHRPPAPPKGNSRAFRASRPPLMRLTRSTQVREHKSPGRRGLPFTVMMIGDHRSRHRRCVRRLAAVKRLALRWRARARHGHAKGAAVVQHGQHRGLANPTRIARPHRLRLCS